MKLDKLIAWLREADAASLETLWREADSARDRHVGGQVHLRGLVEISNHCRRSCAYCGLRHANAKVRRYRMSPAEILAAAKTAVGLGYGTVVLQAGEDEALTAPLVAEVIRQIKSGAHTGNLAVTLSLGERTEDELALWKDAGADRYLLRFETSNKTLFKRIHPPLPGRNCRRIDILRVLRDLGYETGSGIMVGIPGQTYEDLARDLATFVELDLDMIGLGPYVPHADTPLANAAPAEKDQTPNDGLMACKVVALTRLVCPDTNIPATTALSALDPISGYEGALTRGANVVMPNLTPTRYRRFYDIYPMDRGGCGGPVTFNKKIRARIAAIGRTTATGRGDSPHYLNRTGVLRVGQRPVGGVVA